jgi:hypothetical protein
VSAQRVSPFEKAVNNFFDVKQIYLKGLAAVAAFLLAAAPGKN